MNLVGIIELKKKKEALEEELKNISSELENELASLLLEMKESGKQEVEVDGLFCNLFSKENIGYSNDGEVIQWLKDNGYSNFVKTKVTESIDKIPLKKAIKLNESLSNGLDKMIVKTVTEYVTVTTAENHQKMIEHIKEGK